MQAECANFDISRMARLLNVSRAGFYRWRHGVNRVVLTRRERDRAILAQRVLDSHQASDGTYGAPRITADLRAEGILITQKTVAKIMNELGIAGLSPRAFVVKTTITQSQGVYPRDLVKRVFTPARINMIWTSDITYLHCGDGLAYKCSIRDEYSGRVVGWAVADHMREDLVIAALKMAFVTRAQQTHGIIFHTDRGAQFNSRAVRRQCRLMGLKRSMGATGNCFDHATAESYWSIFKHEYYYRHAFTNLTELTQGIAGFIHRYNTTRRYSKIGNISPLNYELGCHHTAAHAA